MATGLQQAQNGRTFIGRLPTDSDLCEEIERFCADVGVHAATVSVVGAMQRAAYAYYNQTMLQYKEMASPRHHELSGFVGNISMRDGKPFLHAHATFADINGECVAGHLLKGCTVWVAEVEIRELTGVELIREHDERTGLALW
jgi:predicted DNA-binding protein with PD1-like motif